MKQEILHKDISEQIIACFYKVYNERGFGFLEKVYENAFEIELKNNGFTCESQKRIDVYYDGNVVGN